MCSPIQLKHSLVFFITWLLHTVSEHVYYKADPLARKWRQRRILKNWMSSVIPGGQCCKFSLSVSIHFPFFLNLCVPTEALSRKFHAMLTVTSVIIFKLVHGCQSFMEWISPVFWQIQWFEITGESWRSNYWRSSFLDPHDGATEGTSVFSHKSHSFG